MFRLATQSVARKQVGQRFASSVLDGPAFKPADLNKAKEFIAHEEAVAHHAKGSAGLWKKITYLVAFPAIGLAAVSTYFIEMEHAHHREHTKHLSDEEWPLDYPYQNVRKKNFFWGDGDKTLFWNSDCNRHVARD